MTRLTWFKEARRGLPLLHATAREVPLVRSVLPDVRSLALLSGVVGMRVVDRCILLSLGIAPGTLVASLIGWHSRHMFRHRRPPVHKPFAYW